MQNIPPLETQPLPASLPPLQTTGPVVRPAIEQTYSEQYPWKPSSSGRKGSLSKRPKPQYPRPWLRENGTSLDGWYVAKIMLRIFSVVTAMSLLILTREWWAPIATSATVYTSVNISIELFQLIQIALYVFSGAMMLWDLSEFVTMACRRGYGIGPKAHIGIELTLTLGGMGITGTIAYVSYSKGRGWDMVPGSLTGIATIIHFLLFFRSCLDRHRGRSLTPRIMYLPTGQPVVVLPRRVPPKPTHDTKDLEMSPITVSAISPISPAVETPQTSSRPPLVATVPAPDENAPPPPPAAAVRSSSPPLPPLPPSPPPPPPRPPRRKPVPARGTPYADPWSAPGEDYEPDEAERLRAERGERQAQWMSLHGVGRTQELKTATKAVDIMMAGGGDTNLAPPR